MHDCPNCKDIEDDNVGTVFTEDTEQSQNKSKYNNQPHNDRCDEEVYTVDPEIEKKSPIYMLYALVGIVTVFALIFGLNYFRDTNWVEINGLTGNVVRPSDNSYEYNGHVFSEVDDIWYTDILNQNTLYTVGFQYDPLTVKEIGITGKISEKFLNSEVYYVTFDPTKENLTYLGLASAELQLSMARAMNLPLKAACTTDYLGCGEVEKITCDNTDKPVFFIEEAETTQILFDDNCITVKGKGTELVKAVDRLLYFWYGIMV